jgi:hypothetical protein
VQVGVEEGHVGARDRAGAASAAEAPEVDDGVEALSWLAPTQLADRQAK